MANSARDPYWQGSMRREVLEHPDRAPPSRTIAPVCHMPFRICRIRPRRQTEVFKRLPLNTQHPEDAAAGRRCLLCGLPQFRPRALERPPPTMANFAVAAPARKRGPHLAPYVADPDRVECGCT